MPNLWPLLTLLPPLALTAYLSRTAWLWLSLAAGLVVLYGAFQLTLLQLASGQIDPALGVLLSTPGDDLTFHNTYYVIAHFHWIAQTILPAIVIGGLLCIGAHPHRTRTDIALFWATVLFTCLSLYGIPYVLQNGGMPRRYVEYDQFLPYYTAARTLALAAIATALLATARPLISLYRSRKAPA